MCNIEKLSFGQTKMEYLGVLVNKTGIQPIFKKRSHSKYDATKEHEKGGCIHRFSKLVQGYVGQTVTPITPLNRNFVT